MKPIIITDHAYTRFKERVGINKKAANRLTEKAYCNGIGLEETSGRLSQYVLGKTKAHERNNNCIKIYGEMVYCFLLEPNGIFLLTVLNVPSDLKKQALLIQKKMRVA